MICYSTAPSSCLAGWWWRLQLRLARWRFLWLAGCHAVCVIDISNTRRKSRYMNSERRVAVSDLWVTRELRHQPAPAAQKQVNRPPWYFYFDCSCMEGLVTTLCDLVGLPKLFWSSPQPIERWCEYGTFLPVHVGPQNDLLVLKVDKQATKRVRFA